MKPQPDSVKSLPGRGPYRNIRSLKDLAFFLNISPEELHKWAYRKSDDQRYSSYTIPKRNGTLREIHAPKEPLKRIQRALLDLLQPIISYGEPVHGFRVGRSIKTNCFRHIKKKTIVKIDIEDFFPSIYSRRVAKLFMTRPFYFSPNIAWMLSNLCTHNNSLPQGAPTSPMIANMCMRKCDMMLKNLAKRHLINYTRYADDITLSSSRNEIDPIFTSGHELLTSPVRKTATGILKQSGFSINTSKTRILNQKNRMMVTGLVVNEKLNVPQTFIRELRRLIYLVRRDGLEKANAHFVNHLDRRKYKASPHLEEERIKKVIEGRLAHLRNIRGDNDILVMKYTNQWRLALNPNYKTNVRRSAQIWERMQTETPQRRGYLLEELIEELCIESQITVLSPFRAQNEQIDGAFMLGEITFLLECKAVAGAVGLQAIDALFGKLSRRPENTWGIFVSMEGFSSGIKSSVSEYPSKRILLITKSDLTQVIEERLTWSELLEERKSALSVRRLVIRDN